MRRIAFWTAVAMGALELGMAPTMTGPDDFWPAAALMAVLFGLGAWWLRRSEGRGPVLLLAVLFAVELLFLPALARSSALDWALQGATLLLAGAGLVASIGALVQRRAQVSALVPTRG